MAEALHVERLSFRAGAGGRELRFSAGGRSPPGDLMDFCPEGAISQFSGSDEGGRRREASRSEDQVAAGGEDLSEEEQDNLLVLSHSSDSSDDAENACCRVTRSRKRIRERAEKEQRERMINGNLVNALANSILDGNNIHERAVVANRREPDELNFTIPDAISACDHIFVEMDYKTVKGGMRKTLLEHISHAIRFWQDGQRSQQSSSRLFLLLIAHERTVLLLYEALSGSVGVVDSHSHGRQQGAIMATANTAHLPNFCAWIVQHIFPETLNKPDQEQEFEISAIRYAGESETKSAPSAFSGQSPSRYATRSRAAKSSPRLKTARRPAARRHKSDKREILPELKGKIFPSAPKKRKRRGRDESESPSKLRKTGSEGSERAPRSSPRKGSTLLLRGHTESSSSC